jgi:hypothetical protein
LFFGGRAPSWSHVTWSKILAEHLHDTQDAVFVDYHTGLGKYGVGQVLCSADPHSKSGQIARRTALKIFGDEVQFLQVANARLATNVKAIATPPSGDILNFTIESRKDGRFSGIFLEFGTLGPFAVLEALMAENAMVQLPNPRDTLRAKARLRRAFCPDDRRWQSAVLARALDVTSRAAAALTSRAS